MDVLNLVKNKNRRLLDLLEFSQKFLLELQAGDLSTLEQFERKSAKFSKILAAFDHLINQHIDEIHLLKKDRRHSERLLAQLDLQKKTLYTLLTLNNKIIESLEVKKAGLSNELSKSDQQKM